MSPITIWFLLLLALLVGEAVTVGLTFLWFAVGAAGAIIVAVLGGSFWVQLGAFLLLSALSLLLVRPLAARLLTPGLSPTNADRVIGMLAVVKEPIDNMAGKGQVSIPGQMWTARSESGALIPAEARVKVLRIEGVKVFVETV